jgi:response regulator RpfG family c-di-GMP phosphodiesterase
MTNLWSPKGCAEVYIRSTPPTWQRGPDEGLAKLRSAGPHAVVVSDMRMPAMDGAEFLATVHAISPDTIRVMLTGCGDFESAKRAVNEGRVFRFSPSPLPPSKSSPHFVTRSGSTVMDVTRRTSWKAL